MNEAEIKSFLAVAKSGNFSHAAQELYTTQPTISRHISSLETELGVLLFTRSKGTRTIELTDRGHSFYSLAKKWESLLSETEYFMQSPPKPTFSISTIHSFNDYVMPDVYRRFIPQYPEIDLDIQTWDCAKSYGLVERGAVQAAFVSYLLHSKSVHACQLFEEDFVLVCNKELALKERVSFDELNIEYEIFCEWTDELHRWHDLHLGNRGAPRFKTNNTVALRSLIAAQPFWSFVPRSMACYLQRYSGVRICAMREQMPTRRGYLLTPLGEELSSELLHLLQLIKQVVTAQGSQWIYGKDNPVGNPFLLTTG